MSKFRVKKSFQLVEFVTGLPADGICRAVQELVQTAHGKAVIDVGAAFFGIDDAGRFQDGKMPGYGGHVVADERLQIADALFTFAQGIDHLQTAGVTQGLEDFGLFVDEGAEFGHGGVVYKHGCLVI